MDIKEEAEKVLRELSQALGEIHLEETYYVVEEINITRGDGEPRTRESFRRLIMRNAPRLHEDGSYVMEVGEWVE